MARTWPRRGAVAGGLALAAASLLCAGLASAHGTSLGSGGRGSVTVPTWLFVLTGGSAVGGSFLLASLVTDRSLVGEIHRWSRNTRVPRSRLPVVAGAVVGVLGLAVVVWAGLFGPRDPLANVAVLVVWVGWWAGYTMTTYLVGNTWPVFDPWRTIARAVPSAGHRLDWAPSAWPSVVGLLALVWVEIVADVAARPRVLAWTVLAYSVLTVGGAVLVGPGVWFRRVDPVARVFEYYGRVAPLSWDADARRIRVRLPGSELVDGNGVADRSEVAFVIALLWATTYDGLISTPLWGRAARLAVAAGLPPLAVYAGGMVGGFAAFLGLWSLAAHQGRRVARTYRSGGALARRFAPSLVPIAAGYHLAHFLEYVLSLSPALVAALLDPTNPAAGQPLATPPWLGGLATSAILVGHLLGVWVAHATAYRLFPSRLQAVRSQVPLVLAMVAYTTASLWLLAQPTVQPPYI